MANIWVMFNSFGEQICFTYYNEYADLNKLDKNKFDISNCSVELNISGYYPYNADTYCVKKIETNEISIIKLDRKLGFPPITYINQDLSLNIVDTSPNIVDASSNIVDASSNIVDNSSNIVDTSSNIVDVSLNMVNLSINVLDISNN
jgi:hypothetical protein